MPQKEKKKAFNTSLSPSLVKEYRDLYKEKRGAEPNLSALLESQLRIEIHFLKTNEISYKP